ncbi:subunit S of type I restriction-modification system [Pectobacterium atrosepticum SCRI1043]|uniref:Subunit S of type I restriction-modification system n=1 Tax=Pectobacterium atrosepticum (strain SCRI 1043 / ATCC BAA-672) TaxID=218491 RepID=Q6D2H5_PECAS|nr:restriction endonuclease subunit S [Pectobacterium atrosepticum]GKV84460.1 type I restriction endonuclease EcoAI subunit S [Pectobacterium carotovorum subsp. carotovorum]AIA71944.1 subunit S of type I restriction-modification system [Pectobacterium atrosepticum]AIK14908.1 subunit S of type I restriction-modification system [Pectobacterium atrosepticum]ATY91647.1 type I restriction endonuclease subunit S [Pectobacterium atrosepticum]KFX15022.1 subunit S of type I restriction-modification sys
MTVEKPITDHIAIWSSALQTRSTAGRGSNGKIDLYGIKKLRELILELAVRGKLVPQDPNDKPASELLKRIAAEKAELVKQGKIKKQKLLPEISEDEKPFELPEVWEWVRLSDISEYIQRGKGPKYAEHGSVKVVSQKCVQWSGFKLEQSRWITDESIHSYTKDRFLKDGDVLWNSTGAGGTAGRVIYLPVVKEKLVVDSHVTLIRTVRDNGKFISNYISTYGIQQRFDPKHSNTLLSGTTNQAELNSSVVNSFLVPFPPQREQERINDKAAELMSLCDQLEQQSLTSLDAHQQLVETLLATLVDSQHAEELAENWARISQHFDTLFTTEASIDAIKQTILQLAVMGLLIESAEFSQRSHLKKYLSFGPKNGLSPSEVKYETDVKVLKLGATSYGYLKLQETKYVDIDVKDKSYLFLKKNDILIQRGNSSNFVGCSLLIEEDFDDLIYPDLMMKIRTKDELLPEYAVLWLSSPFARDFMWSKMTGTSGTMPKISKKVVEEIPIAVPPFAVQNQLVIKIKELFLLCGSLTSRLQSVQKTQLHLADALTDAALN